MDISVDGSFKGDNSATSSFCQTTIDLQNALKSAAENVLSRVTDDAFIEIYKKCYQGFEKRDDIHRPSLSGSSTEARKCRKQFNTVVMESISETISETLSAEIDCKLKELEELKKEQTDTSFIWRPPGNALKHMVPFDSVSKMEEKKQIENHIKKEIETIDLLKARLIQKRLKAKELHDILQSSLSNIENAVIVPAANDSKNTTQ